MTRSWRAPKSWFALHGATGGLDGQTKALTVRADSPRCMAAIGDLHVGSSIVRSGRALRISSVTGLKRGQRSDSQ